MQLTGLLIALFQGLALAQTIEAGQNHTNLREDRSLVNVDEYYVSAWGDPYRFSNNYIHNLAYTWVNEFLEVNGQVIHAVMSNNGVYVKPSFAKKFSKTGQLRLSGNTFNYNQVAATYQVKTWDTNFQTCLAIQGSPFYSFDAVPVTGTTQRTIDTAAYGAIGEVVIEFPKFARGDEFSCNVITSCDRQYTYPVWEQNGCKIQTPESLTHYVQVLTGEQVQACFGREYYNYKPCEVIL